MTEFSFTRFCRATAASVAAACANSVFMSALPGVGCVGASSIAQGAAGTYPSNLTRSSLHASSVFSSGLARNVHFPLGADK